MEPAGQPTLPEILASLMAACGMTQEEWASKLEVQPLSVRRWESGEAVPSRKNLRAIIKQCHVHNLPKMFPSGPLEGIPEWKAHVIELAREARSIRRGEPQPELLQGDAEPSRTGLGPSKSTRLKGTSMRVVIALVLVVIGVAGVAGLLAVLLGGRDSELTSDGAIERKYDELKAKGLDLSVMVEPERPAPESPSGTTGTVAGFSFEDAQIYCNRLSSDCFEVHGAIGLVYSAAGRSAGDLGFPTTDEFAAPVTGYKRSDFEGGHITWEPSAGGYKVFLDRIAESD